MEIVVKEVEACKLSVNCTANAAEIMDKRAEVQNAFKKAPVKGFREGKAPMDAIRLYYAKQIDESLKRALAEHCFHEAVFDQKLRVHGAPRFNSLLLDGGKFVCEFEVHTKPDFQLPDWKNLEVVKPHTTLTAEEVSEKMMQELRERLGDVQPYQENDFVQEGDNVILNYTGSVDGKKVEHLSVEGEMMEVGKNALQGFDSNLLGMKSGETREFDFTTPEGGLPSLSGKVVHFTVELITGSKSTPCALDDTLAHKMGKKDLPELKEFVSQAAFGRVANFDRSRLQEAVSNALVAGVSVAVPGWMSLSEAQYMAQQSQLDWNAMPDGDRERFVQMAEQNVKLSLVLDKIREEEPEAQLSDQETFEIIKQNLANTKTDANLDEVIQTMSKTGQLQILFARIKDEYALNHIVKTVKVIE